MNIDEKEKKSLAIAMFLAVLFLAVVFIGPCLVRAEELPTDNYVIGSANEFVLAGNGHLASTHDITFHPDGTITLDGKDVKELSPPEIKAILSKIYAEMVKQDTSFELCGRQTDYLLEELKKCTNEKNQIIDIVKNHLERQDAILDEMIEDTKKR